MMGAIDDREPLDVLEAIHTSPARRYLKQVPVPESIIGELIDAAIRAPNGGNQQRWAWLVVRDPIVKRELTAQFEPWVESLMARSVFDEQDDAPEIGLSRSSIKGARHLAKHIHEAPVIIVPVARDVSRWKDELDSGLLVGSSIYPAIQNMLLAARAFGLGATLAANPKVLAQWDASSILRLPDDARALHFIPIGYPDRGKFSEPRRSPGSDCTHWDRWEPSKS